MAREAAPSIIFMDEIDSIGQSRGGGGGDSEVQRTMLELLNQLDGFEPAQNIKVIMATNRIDILDSALLRPGRIDRKIEFPNPNAENRMAIMKIHSSRMNLLRNIDLSVIAEKMMNASGAECKAVCTEAGMFALRERRVHVTQEDFEMAVSKVMKKDADSNMSLQRLWKWEERYLLPVSMLCFVITSILDCTGLHKCSMVHSRKMKKGTEQETSKKRTRKTTKFQRSIQGATLENILAKRNQKPEVRKAQREQMVRSQKDKVKAKKEAKTIRKKTDTKAVQNKQKKVQKTNVKSRPTRTGL